MTERIVSWKQYKVLESMVKDGLISGLPYSEMETEETYKEYCKRMKEFEEHQPEHEGEK